MKAINPVSWGTALGAGLFATVALLPQAKGELVYEGTESVTGAQGQAQAQKMDDRSTMRQAIGSSERAQATLQAQSQPGFAAGDDMMMVAPAPAMSAPVETSNYSKAELMRRERQREELKNEDILQERLEELRLRDERRRTQEVLTGSGAIAPGSDKAVQSMPLQDEVVMAPATETAGKPSLAPSMPLQPQAAPAPDMVTINQSMAVAPGLEGVQASESSSERIRISVAPRAGISNFVGSNGYFEVSPRYAAGFAASLGASEHFSFELAYMFSQYGISMATSNPWAQQQQWQAAMYGMNLQTINMNKNVFDAGVKLHMFGHESRIRPFIGAGGSYSTSYVNFAPSIVAQMNAAYRTNLSPDYNVKNFLGYLSGGLDIKVAKSISVGAEFRYHMPFSDNESSNFSSYNPAFAGGYFGGFNGVNAMPQADTAIAGSSLSRSSFYSVLGTATFTF